MVLKKHLIGFLFLLGIILSSRAQEISPALAAQMNRQDDQPIPIYLLLKDRVDLSALEARFERLGTPLAERAPQVIEALQVKAEATQADLLPRLHRTEGVVVESISPYWITNAVFLRATPGAIRRLAEDPAIALIDENFRIEPVGLQGVSGPVLPPSPGNREPGLTAINAPALWKLGYTGYGRKAMIIDTGEDPDHPAIRNQFLGQTVPLSQAWSGSGAPGPCLSGDFGVASHGTHVTGTIVGLDRLKHDTIGVAFNGRWMAGGVNLSGCEGYENGSAQSIVENFQWALNPDGNPNTVSDLPDVINNSWGRPNPPQHNCDGNHSISADLIEAHFAAGIALVFSAGNEGPDQQTHVAPAFISMDTVKVFSVGAVHGHIWGFPIADFSSRGPTSCELPEGSLKIKPEVVAPGVSVRSAVVGGGYQQFNGTSMAGPHAAGGVLLLREAFPQLPGEDILKALYYSAKDLGAPGEDNTFGRGMIDLGLAYEYLIAQGHTPSPPAPSQRDLILLDMPQSPVQCDGGYQPFFTVENAGSDTISSLDLHLSFNGAAFLSEKWTFNLTLAPNHRITLQWPEPVLLPTGSYQVTATLEAPNGLPDDRPLNNRLRLPMEVIEDTGFPLAANSPSPVCAGGSALLRYLEPALDREMHWYDDHLNGNLLGKGDLFVTPPLQEDALFWGELRREAAIGQPIESALLNFDTVFTQKNGLRFDALSDFTLKSLKIIAQEKSGFLIFLRNQEGKMIKSVPVGLQAGLNEIDLNLSVAQGEGYVLTTSSGAGPLLEVVGPQPYPIELPGVLRVTGSTDTLAPFATYPYFFDWVVEYADRCSRQAVQVEVAPGAAPDVGFRITGTGDAPGGGIVLQLEADQPGPAAWNWEIPELDLEAEGPSATFILPEAGAYRILLSVLGESGCVNTIEQIVDIDQVTATQNLTSDFAQVTVFPNPNHGHFYLQFPQPLAAENLTVTLFDPLGRPLRHQAVRISGKRLEVQAGELSQGMYTLRIQVGDKLIVRKLVIR